MNDSKNQIANFPRFARDSLLRLPADGSALSTSGIHGGGEGLLFLAQRGLRNSSVMSSDERGAESAEGADKHPQPADTVNGNATPPRRQYPSEASSTASIVQHGHDALQ